LVARDPHADQIGVLGIGQNAQRRGGGGTGFAAPHGAVGKGEAFSGQSGQRSHVIVVQAGRAVYPGDAAIFDAGEEFDLIIAPLHGGREERQGAGAGAGGVHGPVGEAARPVLPPGVETLFDAAAAFGRSARPGVHAIGTAADRHCRGARFGRGSDGTKQPGFRPGPVAAAMRDGWRVGGWESGPQLAVRTDHQLGSLVRGTVPREPLAAHLGIPPRREKAGPLHAGLGLVPLRAGNAANRRYQGRTGTQTRSRVAPRRVPVQLDFVAALRNPRPRKTQLQPAQARRLNAEARSQRDPQTIAARSRNTGRAAAVRFVEAPENRRRGVALGIQVQTQGAVPQDAGSARLARSAFDGARRSTGGVGRAGRHDVSPLAHGPRGNRGRPAPECQTRPFGFAPRRQRLRQALSRPLREARLARQYHRAAGGSGAAQELRQQGRGVRRPGELRFEVSAARNARFFDVAKRRKRFGILAAAHQAGDLVGLQQPVHAAAQTVLIAVLARAEILAGAQPDTA
jgi:hypothetical protein